MARRTVHRLELRPHPGTLPWDAEQPWDTVDLVLDGRTLPRWLEQVTGEDLGGQLGPHVDVDLVALLRGRLTDDEGRARLAVCGCTDDGCNPLLARIQLGDNEVRWYDLVRGCLEEPVPDLEIVFPRDVYDAALAGWADRHTGSGEGERCHR